ncbi:MAG: hypothetical protein SNI32_06300 [Rikenellaceae bacterium]
MILIARMNSVDVVVQSNGTQIRFTNQLLSSITVTGDIVYLTHFVFDGQYWKYAYMFG